MDDIITPRLRLRLMPIEFLEASLEHQIARAEAILGLKVPAEWFRESWLIRFRLEECRFDPDYRPWSLRAIAWHNQMIGHIGFHSRPNPDYLQPFVAEAVEFGYTVFAPYRRQGFAFETTQHLMSWAKQQYALRAFVLSISPDNVASLALAKKLGFMKIGEHQDEIDDLEEVYALYNNTTTDFRN